MTEKQQDRAQREYDPDNQAQWFVEHTTREIWDPGRNRMTFVISDESELRVTRVRDIEAKGRSTGPGHMMVATGEPGKSVAQRVAVSLKGFSWKLSSDMIFDFKDGSSLQIGTSSPSDSSAAG